MTYLISSTLFWGTILILVGLSMVLNVIIGISIPIFRLVIAFLLIYGGINLITGKKSIKWHSQQWQTTHNSDCREFRRYFSDSTIDFSKLTANQLPYCAHVQVAFAQTKIYLSRRIPTKIITHASFSNVQLPDQDAQFFGTHVIEADQSEQLLLEISVHFSNVIIKYIN